jgi:uncharacterized membrane protein HdeD (DUF308 family)
MQIKDNKATLCLAILTVLCGAILPYVPHVSAALVGSVMGALGTIHGLIKTYESPPAKLVDGPKP